MKLSELKKLTNNELASRFPFIIVRNWNGELAKDEDGKREASSLFVNFFNSDN